MADQKSGLARKRLKRDRMWRLAAVVWFFLLYGKMSLGREACGHVIGYFTGMNMGHLTLH